MLWKLDVISGGETVAEHEGVNFSSRTFFMIGEGEDNTVPGFTAYDADGNPIESVGGHDVSLEGKQEGIISISGLWVHFRGAEAASQSGLYYGVLAEDGSFVEAGALEHGQDDPRLQREWNLRPLLEGAGYGGSDPD